MKEYRQEPGGRRVKGDDMIAIQDIALVSEQFLGSYENFVISGCEIVGAGISSGIVMLGGKACTFDGLPEVTRPFYVKKIVETEPVSYETGTNIGYEIFKAAKATPEEEGAFRLDNAPRFADIFKPENAINADTVDGKHANELVWSGYTGDANSLSSSQSGIYGTVAGTVNVPHPNQAGHSILNLCYDKNSGSQLFINKVNGQVLRRVNNFGWKAWENMSFSTKNITDWDNIPDEYLAAGTVLVGINTTPNSPSEGYFTAIALSIDNNPKYARLIGMDVYGDVWTRQQNNGLWGGWRIGVDGQRFAWSNDNNAPTYLWGTNSFGLSFLANRASLSVGKANTADSLATARTIWGQGFNGTGNIRGTLWDVDAIQMNAGGSLAMLNGSVYGSSSIELYGGTPFIDFHFNNSTADYTTRIIETSAGVLHIYAAVNVTGNLAALGFYQSSDERLKDIKADFEPSLEDILELPLFYYTLKDTPDKLQIGTSAQRVMDKFPELVTEDAEGYYSVAYDKLAVLALRGLRQQNEKQKQLEDKLSKLEERLTKIENSNE